MNDGVAEARRGNARLALLTLDRLICLLHLAKGRVVCHTMVSLDRRRELLARLLELLGCLGLVRSQPVDAGLVLDLNVDGLAVDNLGLLGLRLAVHSVIHHAAFIIITFLSIIILLGHNRTADDPQG